jgi:rod shape-determining protein MreC
VTRHASNWAFGVVAALVVALLNLPPSAAGRLRLAAASLFVPLFGLAGAAAAAADQASYELLTRRTLITELERTKHERDALALQAAKGRAALDENNRLRALIGWQSTAPWKTRPAKVVGRNPAMWWRGVTIDFGAREGARINQAVLTPAGLVGRIRSVETTSSEVALLGDPECGVSAVVRETRDLGLIQEVRSSAVGDGFLTVRTLQICPGILPGHAVETSGFGGVFPAGISIGTVVDTRPGEGGLYTEARLRVAADLNRLEEVLVIAP